MCMQKQRIPGFPLQDEVESQMKDKERLIQNAMQEMRDVMALKDAEKVLLSSQ